MAAASTRTLALSVTHPEVLRILLSIGPTETSHFQTWHDKAGNAVSDPLAPLTDPTNTKLVFPNLNVSPFGGEDFQTNLIMPEPCPFLNRKFPVVSIIRPTSIKNSGAVVTVKAFKDDGLFIGQKPEFFDGLAGWRAMRTRPRASVCDLHARVGAKKAKTPRR